MRKPAAQSFILIQSTAGCSCRFSLRDPLPLGYNRIMSLAVFAIRLMEVLFLFGLAGSAIVVIVTFIEDAKELFGED